MAKKQQAGRITIANIIAIVGIVLLLVFSFLGRSYMSGGELGFDIGAYFIKGIKEFRSDFKNNIHNFSYSSMEFPFNFEKKDSKSGYQNKSILFITKNSSGTITVR